ncbi:MAG TPA: lysine-sensitive aspartokinase 3 [Pyrinomonadaceae bacterium]|nr:lysine-sensitive aspartokinase 3 [Pyrinomonadaceae bacterium]
MDRPTILKFGGTSVEDARAFARVAQIIGHAHQHARPIVVVVSAMSRVTDALVTSVRAAEEGDSASGARSLNEHFERHSAVASELLKPENRDAVTHTVATARREIPELLDSLAARRMPRAVLQDVILSYGERLSATLLAAMLREHNLPGRYVDARRFIITDDRHGAASPLTEETTRRTRSEVGLLTQAGEVPVLGGFIGATASGATTTLGRGGSDYSAAIVGAALSAREIQIWTDVSGVLTADPRVVPQARTVSRMSYAEAAELAYFGAKVLHPKTIQPATEQGIPVRICNSRAPDEPGTLVDREAGSAPGTVKAIAYKTGVTVLQVTSARMLGAYGFLRALFEVFERHRTVVDVVTTSEVSVSLTLDETSALAAILGELREICSVEVETNRAIVCVVGEGMRGTNGLAGKIFSTINDINVSLISLGASSINLTFVVDEARAHETVQRLHRVFFEREGDGTKAITAN